MTDAAVHYTNLDQNGGWKAEHHPKAQIIALTTQLTALQTQIKELKKVKSGGDTVATAELAAIFVATTLYL